MKYIFSLILFFTSFISVAQKEIREYVVNQTHEVLNIDTISANYNDLYPIGNAIGEARIVMLGEQDHGDAPTFLAKTRLIKYLHEKKNFNVIAFESDFYALTEGWDELTRNQSEIDSFLNYNIHGIWTKCDACHNLFYNYISKSFKTAAPLQITGFDSNLLAKYSRTHLSEQIGETLNKIGMENTGIVHAVDALIRQYIHYSPKPESFHKNINDTLEYLKSVFEKRMPNDIYWMNIANSLLAMNWRAIHTTGVNQKRDPQMAYNLEWLLNHKYKNEKVIVWAANAHITKYADSLKLINKKLFFDNSLTTTLLKNKKWRNNTFTIGFASYTGSTRRLDFNKNKEAIKVVSPRRNSFETWIPKNYRYSFTDFKQFNYLNPKYRKSFSLKESHYNNRKAPWHKAFDGIFFIREMYGCKPLQSKVTAKPKIQRVSYRVIDHFDVLENLFY